MSSSSLAIIENIKERISNSTAEHRAKNTYNDIIQYNIRLDGKVVKIFGVNLKDYVFVDGPVAENDVEITIDDADFISSIHTTASLTELHNQVSIKSIWLTRNIHVNCFFFIHREKSK